MTVLEFPTRRYSRFTVEIGPRLAYLAYWVWRTWFFPEWRVCKTCREPYTQHAGRFSNLCRQCGRGVYG